MTIPRFLQIHTLHSYPAALLNRDDSGLAKRMPFGGAVRTRVSSQCLKRHWRDPKDEKQHEYALHRIEGVNRAIRTRNIIGREVIQPLRGSQKASPEVPEVLSVLETAFVKGVYGDKAKPGDSPSEQATRQPLLLGLPELEFLKGRAQAIFEANHQSAEDAENAAKKFFGNNKKNFEAMREQLKAEGLPKGRHGGLEGALFGRMVTSDPGANIDAAIHVAHAFTVHQEESESDYCSVVDDLQREDEDPGAAHIGDMELTAGLFYGYVVVDVPGLVSNLTGCKAEHWASADKTLAGQVVEHLVQLIATVSPGAKLGSTAPYGYADLLLIEAGSRQPRSLANAFRKPVKARTKAAVDALTDHLSKLDSAYGPRERRRVMAVDDCTLPQAERLCLDDLAAWAAQTVRDGEAG